MNDALPLTYRAAEVGQVMAALRAGESCTVVGIGSVGKSNLLRFLERQDVLQATLGPAWKRYLLVYLDLNKMLDLSLWGLAELMLHQALRRLNERDVDKDILAQVEDLHQRAMSASPPELALRYLDRAIDTICRKADVHLVVLLDEFDSLSSALPARAPAILRALRDDHKGRLAYVVAIRAGWSQLRKEVADLEPFEELVSLNTVWLGPYNEADARLMLDRLGNRHHFSPDAETADRMLVLTGGHPGLLRVAFRLAMEQPPDLPAALSTSHLVADECCRIWFSMSLEEQRVLAWLATGHTVDAGDPHVVEQLRRKGLIGGPWGGDEEIFSPLFGEYIQLQQPVVGARIQVDRSRRTVWADGIPIGDWTPLEFSFISYLAEHRGQVCSRDELAKCLYPKDMAAEDVGVTNSRVDAVAKRVRKRLALAPKAAQCIQTVRGHGFCLTDGDATAA